MRSPVNALRFLLGHPLARGRRAQVLERFVRWQLGSRLTGMPVVASFVDDTRLIVEPGMTGATGNVYVGLHEFVDMAFVLHFLRRDDLFVDAGANVGSYSVIAAGAVGARVLALEPVPDTARHLRDNINLNGVAERVEIQEVALGRETGEILVTRGLGPMNHVVASPQARRASDVAVPQRRLDDLLAGRVPTMIKIDVEGYEGEVLAGAADTLSRDRLQALIVEVGGGTAAFGQTADSIASIVERHGLRPCTYAPFERVLRWRDGPNVEGNTLYVRDLADAQNRVRTARRYHVGGRSL